MGVRGRSLLHFFALSGSLIGGLSGAYASSAWASEPDNFTLRPSGAQLEDRRAWRALNDWTNTTLNQVARDQTDCDLKSLHLALKDALGGGEIGKLEHWAIQSESLPKFVVDKSRSIYAEAGVSTGSFGIAIAGVVPSVVVNRHFTGVDKFGHFFDQGYAYYEEIFLRHAPELTALETLGLEDEDGSNGMATNGIRSYADMAANFQGFLFWRSVAGGARPYFRCDGTKYVRTERLFDWGEYVSDAWDEGLNCSEFSERVDEVVKASPSYRRCPLVPQACQAMYRLPCAYTYVSPACLRYAVPPVAPDEACAAILREDVESQACTYAPDWKRTSWGIFILDNYDAAKTLLGDQLKRFKPPKLMLRRYGP